MTRLALLSWAWVNLVGGGIVSVIPLPVLAFLPRTDRIPLLDAYAVHTDPDSIDCDLAAASKRLGQHKKRLTHWGLKMNAGL
jgi:hypothetical protein